MCAYSNALSHICMHFQTSETLKKLALLHQRVKVTPSFTLRRLFSKLFSYEIKAFFEKNKEGDLYENFYHTFIKASVLMIYVKNVIIRVFLTPRYRCVLCKQVFCHPDL